MELFSIAVIVVQVLFAVHAVRTGRPLFWIFVIVFVPLIGCAIYFFVAVMPDLAQSRTARHAATGLVRTVDPGRNLRRLEEALEIADTIDNRRALADEYILQGRPERAIGLYRGALVGAHEDDAVLMYGLARALFATGAFDEAVVVLERMRAANPAHEMANADLLLARALEEAGRAEEALARYRQVVERFPGAEAKARFGSFLLKLGRREEGEAVLGDVVRNYERSARPFRHAQREWYDLARQRLSA